MSSSPSIKGEERGAHMLFRAKTFQEVPKEAVLLSRSELLQHMYKEIDRHPKVSEIWPLKYDRWVSGGASALTCAMLTHHYRKMFMLRNFGRAPTYAACLITGLVTSTLHHDFIKERILTGYHDCPLCISTRGGVIQAASCIGYSMIISPALCMLVARSYHTYPVPSFKERSLCVKMIKSTSPLGTSVMLYLAANFMLGSLLSDRELTVYEKVFGHKYDPSHERGEFYTDLKT